jgi:hypothetical protein
MSEELKIYHGKEFPAIHIFCYVREIEGILKGCIFKTNVGVKKVVHNLLGKPQREITKSTSSFRLLVRG